MYSDGSALEELPRDECLQLMASVPIGRVVYTRRALPAVELVNFAFDRGDIVIRTDRGGKLAAATHGTVVAFEADWLDLGHQVGWSVTAIGSSREVTDPGEVDRLRRIDLSSWAPCIREHFIRITPQILNGRRLRARGDQNTARTGREDRAMQIVSEDKLAALLGARFPDPQGRDRRELRHPVAGP